MQALENQVDKLLEADFHHFCGYNRVGKSQCSYTQDKRKMETLSRFQALNTITKKDPCPLPFLDQILDAEAGIALVTNFLINFK